ncbi:MAG: aminoacyl--tRNA ligase-related protein [bacterium]
MKQSILFTKTRKEAPKDEVSKNAQLLIRAGFIHKEMAGVYSFLPLGLKVIKKIEDIIREEMNILGGVEMKTSIFQNKEVWEKSKRWDDEVVDAWFKTKLKNGGEIGLSFTNEEAYANILKQYINSYKDLPVYAYDFKDIFRNEARSKSGILRGREFFWKAMYSFSKNEAEHNEFYEKAKVAYINIFKRAGIGDLTHLTFASGGTFSKYSHEFQTITEAGEDLIYVDEEKNIAINKEVILPEVFEELGVDQNKLIEKKAIEVGNIFSLGTKFSEPFDLKYKDESGNEQYVIMGSYGIGLGRLMGTIVEVLSDEEGIVWPESVAPFKVHLISLGTDEKTKDEAENLYKKLIEKNVEVLWDDRDLRPGEKFSDSDLIGIPYRVVVSAKTIEANVYELKERNLKDVTMMTEDELFAKVA